MVKSNIINPNIPQPQISLPEAVNALLLFMDQQLRINKEVATNLELVRHVLYEPEIVRRFASRHTCMEAIM